MPIDYEHYRFETPDGYELGLYRSRPIVPDRDARPVLLLPGVSSNRFGFGVVREASLPAALNAVGRDVWVLEFRGCRSSRYLVGRKGPVTIDHKLNVDLPTAIEEVLRRSGASQVDLVGHSLGGIFVYLHCGGPHGRHIGRAVTLAAPATFRRLLGRLTPVLTGPARALAPAASKLPGFGIDRLAKVRGPLPHLFAMRQHVRRSTLDRRERRLYLDHAIEDLPGGDLAQLMRWVGAGRLRGRDGRDYGWRLGACRTPLRLIAAATDPLIPLAGVREAYERLGSAEKDLVVVGRRHGSSRDFAHADMLLSRHAVDDVHPHVTEWLTRDAESFARAEAEVAATGGTWRGRAVR